MKIHGNWCGPNWTGGQKVSAEDYKGSWDYPAISPLDEACRQHDKRCSKGFCSKSADSELIAAARKRVLSFSSMMKMMVQQEVALFRGDFKKAKKINARIRESDDADLVITGISIARPFRTREHDS